MPKHPGAVPFHGHRTEPHDQARSDAMMSESSLFSRSEGRRVFLIMVLIGALLLLGIACLIKPEAMERLEWFLWLVMAAVFVLVLAPFPDEEDIFTPGRADTQTIDRREGVGQ